MRRHAAPALMRINPALHGRPRVVAHDERRAMTGSTEDIRAAVLEAIGTCAPEIKPAELPGDRPLGGLIDLDSLDWINVRMALQQRLHVELPYSVQCQETSIDAIVDLAACRRAVSASRADMSLTAPGLAEQIHCIRGVTVTVRPIHEDDEALEASFVRGLSGESRYMRFMGAMNELPAQKLEQLTHVDQDRHVALVAVIDGGTGKKLAGVVRYVVDASGKTCEFAATIDDEWQGTGLAGILMDRLIALARSRGLQAMDGLVLRTNTRMLKLAHQLGFRHEPQADARDAVRINLPLQHAAPVETCTS